MLGGTTRRGGALVLALCALALTVCGPPKAYGERVRASVDRLRQAGSAAFSLRIEITPPGKEEPLMVRGHGASDFRNHNARVSFDFPPNSAGIPAGTSEFIVVGETTYIRIEELETELPAGKRWLRVEPGDPGAESLAPDTFTDPAGFVALLEGTTSADAYGEETIGLTQTTRYIATIDLDKAIEAASGGARAQLERARTAISGEDLLVDTWLDAAGHLRRMQFSMPLGLTGRMRMTLDMARFGGPVKADPPPADEVVALADLRR